MPPPRSALPVLVLALLGISFAAPLVRMSAAHPLAIAIWRLGFSLLIVAAFLLATGGWRQWRALRPGAVLLALGAGVMLALHFWTWNASIGLTTIAASVVLVNLQPAIVAGLSALWLRETPSRGQMLGIALAMLGAFVVATQGAGLGWLGAGSAPEAIESGAAAPAASRAVLGNLLALAGGVVAALYYLAGRSLRRTLDLWPYVALVYFACFLTLIVFALAVRAPVLGQPPRELLIFAALAIGPMMLGHTGMNWALKYLPAYVVNLTVLGEPVGATILAAVIPGIGERPTAATILGGALILAGALGAGRAQRPAPADASPA